VEQVLDGDLVDTAFTTAQLAELERTLMRAGESTGAHFSAYVGKLPARRDSALSIHRQLDDPDMSVLVAVDPESRFVEVVTGAIVRDHLDDQSCRLACLTMTSRFAIGDIAAGIRDGIIVLGDHARSLRVLHTDLPD
jgi:hypothetical protein